MAEPQKQRLIFMGTPDFAVRVLRRLAAWPLGKIVAVYTQPDRPAGRGHKLLPPPAKFFAHELGLPVFQPSSLKILEAQQEFANLRPDFLVVASYGLILPEAVLASPRLPSLNVHPSLLPLYRGAAPVQRAIMENWEPGALTGVSIMGINAKLDAGPVYASLPVPIAGHTAGELLDLLAEKGADILLSVMGKMLDKNPLRPLPQDDALATYADKVSKQESWVSWNRPVAAVHAHIRALTPAPGARAVLRFDADNHCGGEWPVLLTPGEFVSTPVDLPAGSLLWTGLVLRIICSDGWYELFQIRPQGGTTMPVRDFVNGRLRDLPSGPCGMAFSSLL
jgi:methionyl-tRNA formyltransferase